MKTLRPLAFLVGAVLLCTLPFILYYPIHDLFGLWNTRYSARFSNAAFARIHIGMPRASVEELLGEPLQVIHHSDYSVWALRESRVRNRYGKDSKINIEVLSFSAPKHSRDYELVQVTIGPEATVIETDQWVTD